MKIETNRLVLREFKADDWSDFFSYQQSPEYLELYPWDRRREEDSIEFVNLFIEWQKTAPRRKFQLVVTLKGDEKAIGSCGIRLKDGTDLDADLGYEIAPPHWGNGLATEAVRAMVRFGFENLHLHRLSSWCTAQNVRSIRVLEKLGMKTEGRLRESEQYKDRYWDTLLFGLLRSEWKQEPGNVFDLAL